MKRCEWANNSLIEQVYHDKEWGIPVHNDRLLFEFLILEAAQAGLRWETILKKRQGYRIAYDNFEADKIAYYSKSKLLELSTNPYIIRNRLKINSAQKNAAAFLEVQAQFGSFDTYIWQFVSSKTRQNIWEKTSDIPMNTAISHLMSQDLKKRGFTFIGPTMCYAFMQAVGMVNDHIITCFRYQKIKKMSQ
ncbi:MAG: DNA-3-methyladenine glycosylase I [Thiomargarita sp.]|nr:DNA-3-methyladenine glycosylase I [Thiomargarita sp.]